MAYFFLVAFLVIPKLLPSSKSKRAIWKTYEMAANSSEGIQVVAYSTFCQLWQKLLPSIIIMCPMTDLCWQCQQNSTTILRSANASDLEKSATLSKAIEHLRVVTVERSYYRSISEDCRRTIRLHFSEGGNFQPPPLSSMIPANSKDIKAHYSFDYAQIRQDMGKGPTSRTTSKSSHWYSRVV